MDPPHVLPPLNAGLTRQQLTFLDAHFASREDLPRAGDLLAELNRSCADSDGDLASLRGRLARIAVSWIYRSLGAKCSIQKLDRKLENLSRFTLQHGAQSDRARRIFGEELPQLAKQVRQIENVREYVGTTLRLEMLVGDLEDSVFFVSRQAGNMLSGKASGSVVQMEAETKQETLLRAIKAMNNIEDILIGIVKFHPRWCHLVRSVDDRVDKTLAVFRPKVIADYRSLLATLGWPPKLLASTANCREVSGIPNPLLLMQQEKRESFSRCFLSLCALQHLQTRRQERNQHVLDRKENKLTLWAIDELVSPIAVRMEYHFTKWVEQPELIFALTFKVTRDFLVGVEDVLQPLIDKARLVAFSAREAWLFSMVQILSGFLVKKVFSPLAENYKERSVRSELSSSWLNLMDLIVAFDSRMQSLVHSESCLYMGSELLQCLSQEMSVLNIFCERPEWLRIWAKIEFKDAWKKFKSELKHERAWLLNGGCRSGLRPKIESEDYLLAGGNDHGVPVIADSMLKIAWTLIERCRSLPSISLRVQFVRSTAGKLLWCFINVLTSHCRIEELQYDSLDDDDVIIRVCGSTNAARYVECKLQEWSDDVKFLDIILSEKDVELRKNGDVGYNSFFGEEIKMLSELETSWLMEIIAVFLQQFEVLSWEYVQNKQNFGLDQDFSPSLLSSETDLCVSANLVVALDALRSQLQSIRMSLNQKDFTDLWRHLADGLDHFLFRSIITDDICFTEKGIDQFTADMRALYLVFQPFCARPEAFFPCIRDTLRLLNMNVEEVKHLQVVLSGNEKQIDCAQLCGVSHLSLEQVSKLLRVQRHR